MMLKYQQNCLRNLDFLDSFFFYIDAHRHFPRVTRVDFTLRYLWAR